MSGITRSASKYVENSNPSDWPTSHNEYVAIDKLLRCKICHGFISIAEMLRHCSHTFCSSCIHHWLTFQNTCPSCGHEAKEDDLMYNRMIDDVLKYFLKIRFKVLGSGVSESNSDAENDPVSVKENGEASDGQHNLKSPEMKEIHPALSSSLKDSSKLARCSSPKSPPKKSTSSVRRNSSSKPHKSIMQKELRSLETHRRRTLPPRWSVDEKNSFSRTKRGSVGEVTSTPKTRSSRKMVTEREGRKKSTSKASTKITPVQIRDKKISSIHKKISPIHKKKSPVHTRLRRSKRHSLPADMAVSRQVVHDVTRDSSETEKSLKGLTEQVEAKRNSVQKRKSLRKSSRLSDIKFREENLTNSTSTKEYAGGSRKVNEKKKSTPSIAKSRADCRNVHVGDSKYWVDGLSNKDSEIGLVRETSMPVDILTDKEHVSQSQVMYRTRHNERECAREYADKGRKYLGEEITVEIRHNLHGKKKVGQSVTEKIRDVTENVCEEEEDMIEIESTSSSFGENLDDENLAKGMNLDSCMADVQVEMDTENGEVICKTDFVAEQNAEKMNEDSKCDNAGNEHSKVTQEDLSSEMRNKNSSAEERDEDTDAEGRNEDPHAEERNENPHTKLRNEDSYCAEVTTNEDSHCAEVRNEDSHCAEVRNEDSHCAEVRNEDLNLAGERNEDTQSPIVINDKFLQNVMPNSFENSPLTGRSISHTPVPFLKQNGILSSDLSGSEENTRLAGNFSPLLPEVCGVTEGEECGNTEGEECGMTEGEECSNVEGEECRGEQYVEESDHEDVLSDVKKSIANFDKEAAANLTVISNSFQSENQDCWPALSQILSPDQENKSPNAETRGLSSSRDFMDEITRERRMSENSDAGSDISVVSLISEMSDVIPVSQVSSAERLFDKREEIDSTSEKLFTDEGIQNGVVQKRVTRRSGAFRKPKPCKRTRSRSVSMETRAKKRAKMRH